MCFASETHAGRRFVEVGVGRGLDAIVVPAMLVDRDGLLWVGSREGLYRYDGYLATAFLPVPGDTASISDVDVRALYEARDGALWISTNTAGLNRLDRRTGRFTRYRHDSRDAHSLSDPSVYGVAEDGTGKIWVGSQRGLNRLDDAHEGRFTRFLHQDGRNGSLANDWVYALHLGRSGTLWVGTVGGGIDRWDDATGRFENFLPSALTRGGSQRLDDVFALHEAKDGRLWAGTRGGLVVIDPARRTAKLVDLGTEGDDPALITCLRADGTGRLWAASMQHGVFEVYPESEKTVRTSVEPGATKSGRPAPSVLSIATGPHHVFIGTWGSGVYRAQLDVPPFQLIGTAESGGLRNGNVTAVLAGDQPGKPWAGSFGGGPQQVDLAAETASSPPGPSSDRIWLSGVVSLARLPDQTLFAGSTEGLFIVGDPGRPAILEKHDAARHDSIGGGYVAALLPAGNGDLWVGVGGSGLHLRTTAGQYRAYRHDPRVADSLSGNYITAIAQGAQGYLWVGTRSEGLNSCRVEPWSCKRYEGEGSGPTRPADHHVTALRRDSNGALWVATDGGGAHRITESPEVASRRVERWGATDGLIDDGIMAVEEDSDGSVWLSSRHGLARLDPRSGRIVNHVAESGLPVTNFNTGASAADATHLYFGSVDGLLALPKGTTLTPRPLTPVAITAVERLGARDAHNRVQTALDQVFEMQYRDGLAVEFAVLDFAETRHEYAYRMDPHDDWTPLGQRRQLTFLGLEPGHYRFEVRGRDVFGQWNTSRRSLEFKVVPPVWMTAWFRALAAATLVLLALSVHRARMRALETRNATLENLERQREVALERARTSQRELQEAHAGLRQLTGRLESAKEDERARISRELHDEFGQTLTAAKITLQMLRKDTRDQAVADGLAQSVTMVDGMIRQARDIARGLRPPLLDEAGLVPALEHHLASAAARSGLRIEMHAEPSVIELPAELETTVFRVVQEAVSNALRHAVATEVTVTLRTEPMSLHLVIEDDGIGFDPDSVEQRIRRGEHLGLLGMTERVRNAGGTIAFKSRKGGGSRVEVELPVVRRAANTMEGRA